MKKLLLFLSLAVSIAVNTVELSAKQTVEEATDSIKAILDNAKKGDSEAQNEVGRWYYIGRHFKQNYSEAIKWWSLSAKQGNIKAIGNMAVCYRLGHGVEADSVTSAKLMLKSIEKGNKALLQRNMDAAKKGDLFADMILFNCYSNGIGVTKNPDKAISYLTDAANRNSVTAQRDLGMTLLNNKKYPEAAQWFKKGSDNGNPTCTFYYGKMLLEGMGTKKNEKEGANYMLKAAEEGFPQAMYYLGNCYMNGTGLMKNPEQAVEWYKSAAGKGVSNAQWALAQCYRKGIGTTVRYNEALLWYSEAVAKGHSGAFRKLLADSISGTPFMNYMRGVKAYINKDFDTALKEFKKVEKAKIADGKIMTAAILANDSYAKTNAKKAVKLLKSASERSPQAMYLLAGLYEVGKGVNKDMKMAVEYMTDAAESGYGPAQCALGDMYYEGRGVEKSYEKAISLYSDALDQGQLTENAAKRYASCYDNGWSGLEKDKEIASEIIKKCEKNHISELLKLI